MLLVGEQRFTFAPAGRSDRPEPDDRHAARRIRASGVSADALVMCEAPSDSPDPGFSAIDESSDGAYRSKWHFSTTHLAKMSTRSGCPSARGLQGPMHPAAAPLGSAGRASRSLLRLRLRSLSARRSGLVRAAAAFHITRDGSPFGRGPGLRGIPATKR
jgi:hypothetical protein